MLLHALVEHGQSRDDMPPPYYATRPVQWIVALSAEPGTDPALVDVRVGKKDRPRLVTAPYVVRSGKTPPPFLVADSALYVLGVPKTDKAAKVPSTDAKLVAQAQARHAAWRTMTTTWTAQHPDLPEARALTAWLDGPGLELPEGLLSEHNVAVQVDGWWVHDLPEARAHWASLVQAAKTGTTKGDDGGGICLVCGTSGPLLSTLPGSVRNVVGGGMNPQLVALNQPAYYRAGVKQLGATPICEPCGSMATATLNTLIGNPDHHWRGKTTSVVWWTREPVDSGLFGSLDDPDPADVAVLIQSLRKTATGQAAVDTLDTNAFYAVVLEGQRSRVAVRDWIDIPVPAMRDRIALWWADQQVYDPWTDTHTVYPLWRLAQAAARWDKRASKYIGETAPHGLDHALLHAALHHAPPPASLLPTLLQRIRADGRIDLPRAALLRLILTRHYPQEPCMPQLDPTATDPGYVCGRIFATFASVQRTAMPTVNASIADRYFGTVVTSPGTILPRLRVGAHNHLRLIKRKNDRTARILENRISELFDLTGELPPHLTVAQQARFILGYEHQRADDIRRIQAYRAAKQAGDTTADHDPIGLLDTDAADNTDR